MNSQMNDWTYSVPNQCGNLGAPQGINSGWINRTVSTIVLPLDQTIVGAILGADNDPIPSNFTWIGKPGIETGGLRNQNLCGSCFAFSICGALGDRYAIKYGLNQPPVPSPLWIISNVSQSDVCLGRSACGGGIPQLACKWVEGHFVKSESCWPYNPIMTSNRTGVPTNLKDVSDQCCADCCNSGKGAAKYYIQPGSTKPLVALGNGGEIDTNNTILAIQKEIMKNGPVVTAFDVYNDFEMYWKALRPGNPVIYKRNPMSQYAGGHAVVIVGWITIGGQRAWIIRNSWGSTGDNGLGYISFYSDASTNVGIDIPVKDPSGGLHGGVTVFQASNGVNVGPQPPVNNGGGMSNSGQGFTLFGLSQSMTIFTVLSVVVILIILFAIGVL